MPNYPDQGTKTVKCRCGVMNDIPFQTTIYKCPSCGETSSVSFYGTVKNKYGDYVYQTKIKEE